MRRSIRSTSSAAAAGILAVGLGLVLGLAPGDAVAKPSFAKRDRLPDYEVDATWPKPLPNQWLVGQVGGIAVDRHDKIWIVQRQRSLTNDEAWATDAIGFECADGTIPVPDAQTGVCGDASVPTAVDGLGNPRPDGGRSHSAACRLPQ